MSDPDETTEKIDPRIFCFERPGRDQAFEASVTALLSALQKQSRALFMSEENVLRFHHGGRWVHSARDDDHQPAMHSISAEWSIPYKDIADNDLSLIERSIIPINESMGRQFAQSMYGMVGEAAERVGNIVDARVAGSIPQSFLEMLTKIEFGVDREGNVSLPEIHVSPEMGDRILKELEAQPPEFTAEVERVKAEKAAAALQKERERKAKFKATNP